VAPTTATFIFLFFYVIIILIEKLKALLNTLKLSGFSFSSVLFYKNLVKEKAFHFIGRLLSIFIRILTISTFLL